MWHNSGTWLTSIFRYYKFNNQNIIIILEYRLHTGTWLMFIFISDIIKSHHWTNYLFIYPIHLCSPELISTVYGVTIDFVTTNCVQLKWLQENVWNIGTYSVCKPFGQQWHAPYYYMLVEQWSHISLVWRIKFSGWDLDASISCIQHLVAVKAEKDEINVAIWPIGKRNNHKHQPPSAKAESELLRFETVTHPKSRVISRSPPVN
jgi:hypothetical protein